MDQRERLSSSRSVIDINQGAWNVTEEQMQIIRDVNPDPDWCRHYRHQLSLITPREVVDVPVPEDLAQ